MEKPYYQTIVDTLKSVKNPGLYASGGVATMPLPAITLAGDPDAVLGLPLCEAQAKHLIEVASRAPFGRGEQTIVDTSVRCTWQLDPTQFSITNPQWQDSLQLLLPRVKTELGCHTKMNVTCQLYKLLLYEPGGHFKVRNYCVVCNLLIVTNLMVVHKSLYCIMNYLICYCISMSLL